MKLTGNMPLASTDDPIQGQRQGHEPLKVGNSAIFKGYLIPNL